MPGLVPGMLFRSLGERTQVTSAMNSWGRLPTLGLGVIALLAGQTAALMALSWWFGVRLGRLPDFSGDGVAVMLVIFVSTPVQVLLLALFAMRAGSDAADYLGLTLPRRSEVVFGIVAVAAVIIASNALSWLLGQNIVTAFQSDIYRTASAAGWLPWLWLAVVVATPIGEETLFRGFLFRGWLRSPRDAWPVIVVTALLWALTHLQYDWYVTAQVFTFGLLLGWMRWCTGSTLLTMLLHGLINLEGMLETFVGLK
jgi:membrane protease YdiL (CAAX protease family)